MIQRGTNVLIAGAIALGLVSLGGCATEKYVNEQNAALGAQMGGRVDAVSTRVDHVETRVGLVEGTAKDALDRATAAGKLAEGKFLYSEVLSDDSMKFGVAKAVLTPEAQARLDSFADKLKTENRNVYVEVQGHTDNSGAKDINYKLGGERAEVVRRYLNQHGVALNRINTISYGPDSPVAPNTSRDGRKANRRVVLIVLS